MALIEVFHVVASELPIDADSATDIPQGSIVTLDSSGEVALCQGDETYPLALGIAGDSRSTGTTSYTPESGSALDRDPKTSPFTGALVVGALGASQRFTQNRVADNYNEVLASGKMTVYHSGGEFWTDMYETIHAGGTTVAEFLSMSPLYCSDSSDTAGTGEPTQAGGRFTDQIRTSGQVVGFTLAGPLSYPSGVPGVDTGFTQLPEGGNSMTWGTFLHVKLVV